MKNFPSTGRMKHVCLTAFLLAIGVTFMYSKSFGQSGPVVWSVNGHTYEAVYAPGLTWAQAQAACVARGGDLATITSIQENDFVKSLFENNPAFWFVDGFNNALGPWIGGIQAVGSPEPGDGWGWVTGEAFVYTDWSSHDPDNCCGVNQNRIQFVRDGNVAPTRWTDVEDFARFVRGYIFESAASGCVAPPSGLISWWPGDGNADDIVGVNNGTLQGSVSFSAAEVGQGFTLNSNADGVTIPHNPNLNVQSPGFSADFWMSGIKNQPDPFQSTIFEKSHGWVDATGWAFQVRTSTGFPLFAVGDGTGFPEVIGAVDVLDGNFHHIAGTWDGSMIRLYVDGILQSGVVTTASNSTPANNARDVNIGFTWGGGTPQRFFRGIADELEIFNRALSASEIQSIFNAGSAGKCKNQPPNCSGASIPDQSADANCQATISSADVTGVTDPDGDPLTITVSPTTLALGANSVTVTADDGNGGACSTTITVNVADNTAPATTADLILRSLKENRPGDRGRGDFEVACAASDNCSGATASGLMQIPAGFDDPGVEIEFDFNPGAKSEINFHENKNGKLSIELEGADEAALRTQLADILAAGGVAVSDGQLIELRFRVKQKVGQKFDFEFLNGVLVREKVEGKDPQTITMLCTATDGSGNTASQSVIADFSQSVTPKHGGPEAPPGANETSTASIPDGFSLEQNYPNPFNPATTIRFAIREASSVTLQIFNSAGQLVRTLVAGEMLPGYHTVTWNALDDNGTRVASGIYLYTLRAGEFTMQRKLVLMK